MRQLNTVSLDDAPAESLAAPCDWWEQVQLAVVRSALPALTPEESCALWRLAEGLRLTRRQRALAVQAVRKLQALLGLEPSTPDFESECAAAPALTPRGVRAGSPRSPQAVPPEEGCMDPEREAEVMAVIDAIIDRHIPSRWHRVKPLLDQGVDLEDIRQELRLRLWRAALRWRPESGATLEKWLAYRVDYCLRDFERGRYR